MKQSIANFVLILWTSIIGIEAQELYFPPKLGSEWDKISFSEAGMDSSGLAALHSFVGSTESKGFMILKNGKILTEGYYNDHNVDKSWYWASAGKSITSFLIGKAEETGFLNLQYYTNKYLGTNWTECADDSVRVIHQLTMTSGLDYNVDIFCTDPECLKCLNPPGTEWYYHNAPYTLLDGVIANATGQNLNTYTKSVLLNPTGMKGLWVKSGFNNLFFSDTRTMARYGLMALAGGTWSGLRIINEDYFGKMTNTSQNINKSYGYLWWLNGEESYRLPGSTFTFPNSLVPSAPNDMFMALGANAQILLVIPSLNMVVVRMGDEPEGNLVSSIYVNQLWSYIQPMLTPSSTFESKIEEDSIYPNPVSGHRSMKLLGGIADKIEIYNSTGHLLDTQYATREINTSTLKEGVYFAKIFKRKGHFTRKFIVI